MNIVIPIAGRGSRFRDRGIDTPKPMIRVAGSPIVAWGLKSVEAIKSANLIFIALREHEINLGITWVLKQLAGSSAQILLLDDVTDGQLCTVLAARSLIDTDEDLLIISADTYVISDLAWDISVRPADCSGIISVAELPGKNWSFAKPDACGQVIEVAEKQRISNYAGTGLYYFSNGHQFVTLADEMIENQEKTRGEYYVMPLYKKYIERGHKIILSHATKVWDMGNPEALQEFSDQYNTE